MTVTVDDLARRLGMPGQVTDPAVRADLQRALDVAVGLLEERIVVAPADRTPTQATVVDEATLQVAAEGWRRKDAPGGVYHFGDGTDYPAHLSANPLQVVDPTLKQARLVPKQAIGHPPPADGDTVEPLRRSRP